MWTQQAVIDSRFAAAPTSVIILALLATMPLAAVAETRPESTTPASVPGPAEPPAASIPKADFLPPLEPGESKAARWLKLLDQASIGEPWQPPPACREQPAQARTGLCRLKWRKQSGLSVWRGRYEDYTREMTRRLAGDHLADHLEYDIDRSPELRLRYEFD